MDRISEKNFDIRNTRLNFHYPKYCRISSSCTECPALYCIQLFCITNSKLSIMQKFSKFSIFIRVLAELSGNASNYLKLKYETQYCPHLLEEKILKFPEINFCVCVCNMLNEQSFKKMLSLA